VTRVVADTNVYISALNFGGAPDEVLRLARAGAFTLFISPPILQEVEGVLAKKFKWSPTQLSDARTLIESFTTSVTPQQTITRITADPPDNRILECAVAAKAHRIVTGDHHLRDLGKYRRIVIVSPREFLQSKVWTP